MLPTIPDHVLKHGPWSISKAGVIEKCSLQYDYKYGPNKQKEVVTYEASRVGVTVHRWLELALADTSLDDAKRDALKENNLTAPEVESVETFYSQVEAFTKKMAAFKKQHIVTDVYLEQKWGVNSKFGNAGFFGTDVFFRGVVDYALLTKDLHLIVIDHKSGKEKDISAYAAQLMAYRVMALAAIPNIKGVQCAINFIGTDSMQWGPYVSRNQIIQQDYAMLIEHLAGVTKGLLSPPKASKGWWCNWCGYRPLCPAHENAPPAQSPDNTKLPQV